MVIGSLLGWGWPCTAWWMHRVIGPLLFCFPHQHRGGAGGGPPAGGQGDAGVAAHKGLRDVRRFIDSGSRSPSACTLPLSSYRSPTP